MNHTLYSEFEYTNYTWTHAALDTSQESSSQQLDMLAPGRQISKWMSPFLSLFVYLSVVVFIDFYLAMISKYGIYLVISIYLFSSFSS